MILHRSLKLHPFPQPQPQGSTLDLARLVALALHWLSDQDQFVVSYPVMPEVLLLKLVAPTPKGNLIGRLVDGKILQVLFDDP